MELGSFILCYVIILAGIVNISQAGPDMNCPTIKLQNGRARLRSRGRTVQFRCWRGFSRVGPKMAICLKTKQWSKKVPLCVAAKGCPKLDLPAVVQADSLYDGGILHFTCASGYTRKGPEKIYCNGKNWNAEPPVCEEGMSLGCDFESEGLCGWSQVLNEDKIDWIRHKGATPTKDTGPQKDHTFGTPEGHYLFMESSAPVKKGNNAQLISPKYSPGDVIGVCMEFFYHMFGSKRAGDVGSLEVFMKPESVGLQNLHSHNDVISLFQMDGNQGDEWHQQQVTIPPPTQPFQLVFEATKKNSWLSDISLDDIRLFNCTDDTDDIITVPAIPSSSTIKAATQSNTATTTVATKSKTPKQTPRGNKTTPSKKTTSEVTTKMYRRKSTTPTETTRPRRTTTVEKRTKPRRTTPAETARPRRTTLLETTLRPRRTTPVKTTTRQTTTSSIVIVTTEKSAIKTKPTTQRKSTTTIKRIPSKEMFSKTMASTSTILSSQSKKHYATSTSNFVSESSQFDLSTNNSIDLSGSTISNYPVDGNGEDHSQTEIVRLHTTPDAEVNVGRIQEKEGSSSSSSSSSTRLIPLIVGVTVGVLLVAVVISVLAYKVSRRNRIRDEKDMEDQMNIVSEYVETSLNH